MEETTFTNRKIERIRNINDGNLVDYLSSAYELLRQIISYLSLNDLEVAYEVFEKWRPVIDITRRERKIIDSYVFFRKFNDFKTWPEAEFCLTFCARRNKALESKLKNNMSKNGEFIVVECRAGVMGTNSDYSELIQGTSWGCTNTQKPLFASSIRIPNFRDAGVKTFVWYNNVSYEDFRKSFSLPDNKKIKCLLIFMTSKGDNQKGSEQKDDFIKYLRSIQKEGFAIGGCLIDSFFSDPNALTKYIVFYGDKVEAASIVLTQVVQTKEEIESRIQTLKEICPNTDRGVLFVFTCCSRPTICAINTRKRLSSLEGNAIVKNFPSTPIIGCYAYGEIGKKYPEIYKYPFSRPFNFSMDSHIDEHSYSTVLVYLGFNK